MKELTLLRGAPGSGKSTFAKTLGGLHIEADMFFIKDGEYKFDYTKIKDAHNDCKRKVHKAMHPSLFRRLFYNTVVVSNTFTQEWEMRFYEIIARKYGYIVFHVVVENRHGGVNEHGVPDNKLEIMRGRFEIKL